MTLGPVARRPRTSVWPPAAIGSDGIASGSATLFDRHGPIGRNIAIALARPAWFDFRPPGRLGPIEPLCEGAMTINNPVLISTDDWPNSFHRIPPRLLDIHGPWRPRQVGRVSGRPYSRRGLRRPGRRAIDPRGGRTRPPPAALGGGTGTAPGIGARSRRGRWSSTTTGTQAPPPVVATACRGPIRRLDPRRRVVGVAGRAGLPMNPVTFVPERGSVVIDTLDSMPVVNADAFAVTSWFARARGPRHAGARYRAATRNPRWIRASRILARSAPADNVAADGSSDRSADLQGHGFANSVLTAYP